MFEKVSCFGTSSRRIDFIVLDRKKKKAWIWDPTVRFEDSTNQPVAVDSKKKGIYEPTVPFLRQRYRLRNHEIEVFGLFKGAKGTITKFFNDFRKGFKIPEEMNRQTVLSVFKALWGILRHYLYSQLPINKCAYVNLIWLKLSYNPENSVCNEMRIVYPCLQCTCGNLE